MNVVHKMEEIQQTYYHLFNQIADPVFIYSRSTGQILDCNQAVTRLYGYSKDELLQMSFPDFFPIAERNRIKKAIKIINRDVPFTYTHMKKNGVAIHVEILSDKSNYQGTESTISIVRDISDRVRIEEKLKRRAAQSTLVAEISKRVNRILNLETILNEIVTSINDSFDFYGVMLLMVDEKESLLRLHSLAGGYKGVFPEDLCIGIGEGMIGLAARSKQIQLSNDVTKNSNYIRKAHEVTLSELSVPIYDNDKVIGVLDFQSDKKNAFDTSDVEVAETLSSQISSATENARLYEKAQKEIKYRKKVEETVVRRAKHSDLLYQISRKLTGELDLDTLFTLVVTSIRDAFDYYGVMLLLYDESKTALRMQAIAGAYAGVFPVDLVIQTGEGMIGTAARNRIVQVTGDVTQNPDYVRKADEITRSELSVPVIKGDEVIGVLDIQSDKVNAFDRSDVTAAETLSLQIAAAIDIARLYQQAQDELEERLKTEREAQRRAKQAALINQIGQRLSSQLELDALLSETVNSVCDVFDYYGVLLLTLDEEKNILTLVAMAGQYANYFKVGEIALQVGQGMVGQAALTREVQISGNVDENPHYVRSRGEEKTKSELSVPIISGEKVIGVLDIESEEYNAFDESDITVLKTISSQIAAAIANARLFQHAQQEIHERMEAEQELRKSQDSLREAKKETDTILQNVEEGLFIIDPKYCIGSQYSQALTEILYRSELANISFMDIFNDQLAGDIIENIKDYLDLMFNPGIDEDTLADLNPLANVKMVFHTQEEILSIEKFLTFKFKRVCLEGQISELIATVTDITEQVRLTQKLEESEEQSKKQMEWFLSILHVEPQMLKEFIETAHHEMDTIDRYFKQSRADSYKETLDHIYRSVHSIKGNASLMDLKFFANRAHEFEETIESVKKIEKLTASDFVPLVLHQKELRSHLEEVHDMIDRISQIHAQFRPKRSFEGEIIINLIKNLVKTLSRDLDKDVKLDDSQFDGELVPFEYKGIVKDVLIQMVRNSMAHGIESGQKRKDLGKPEKGCITISTLETKGKFCFRFRDDGRGLNLEAVRKKAIASGKWAVSDIESWDAQTLSETIFEPGISTAEETTMVAGRGVGMGIIKQKVLENDGKIKIDSKPDKYLEFEISLPLKNRRKKVQSRKS
ncbi:MAG: GAF domain-containing protein [Calditrichales bacterium]|nr:MAG: GAF domain-containing protein [Calditrichales bacterium]